MKRKAGRGEAGRSWCVLILVATLLALRALPAPAQESRGTESSVAAATDPELAAAAERFLSVVSWLADDAREGRGVGTKGLEEAGEWIAIRFRSLGLEPAGAAGGYHQPFPVSASGHGGEPPVGGEAFNVVGLLPAGSPDPLPGAVVIGAHYDHLGMGGSSSRAPDGRVVHNGADDNASGTAALLEVARALRARRGELRRDVYFVAFSAEELGNIGSSAFVHAPPEGLALEGIIAMLNMDMVGRLRDDRLSVLGGESAEEWSELVAPRCEQLRLVCAIRGDGFGASDHASFFAAGIPVLHFFTGAHDEYHTPADDTHLIDPTGGARIAELVTAVAAAVANHEGPLTLRKAASAPARTRRHGGARLGTLPDYAGPADGRPGVLLSAVRPESPAEVAGLRRGDVIVGLGGREIHDIQDFMAALESARPGERDTVVVERDGERVELEVVYGAPAAR
ncbi:MAG: M20/M25/M40 family metallo-hydrolase [Gemmatimonadota bacterium]